MQLETMILLTLSLPRASLTRPAKLIVGRRPSPFAYAPDARRSTDRLHAHTINEREANEEVSRATASLRLGAIPPDVNAYLTQLAAIESRRTELAAFQLSSSYNSDVATMSQSEVIGWLGDSEDAWGALVSRFRSIPSPNACLRLRAAYCRTLRETGMATGQTLRAMHGFVSKSSAACWTDSGSAVRIAVAPASEAERQLGLLCTRYKVSRPFPIVSVVRAMN
jgi:hypothetical protein